MYYGCFVFRALLNNCKIFKDQCHPKVLVGWLNVVVFNEVNFIPPKLVSNLTPNVTVFGYKVFRR